jgi:RHS repeat-associated protein
MAVTDSGGTKMHLYGYDDNGNLTYDGANAYSYNPENRLTTVERVPDPLSSACDIDLKFTCGGNAVWFNQSTDYYYGNDAAQSGDINDGQSTWLETTVTGPGTLQFAYKLSAQAGDEFTLFIDGVYQFGRSGSIGWNEPGAFSITGEGTHTIRWRYKKDSSGSEGSDCLWIDHVRWTGAMPSSDGWKKVEYVYDLSGRRIEKKYDGVTQVKYVYDGDHIIAEYDAGGTLLRKYVHGLDIDEPICLIESSGTYTGTQYYHYDALGSVVAMTNSTGNVTQLYEYSVYGQVAASDPNHPNRFMFTGREFDKDTGLYHYRARYYHPEIGRFLQADSVGYEAGMNLYRYCVNNPLNMTDPFGNDPCGPGDPCTVWVCFCQCDSNSPAESGDIKFSSDPLNGDSACAAYCYVMGETAAPPAQGLVVRGAWESIKALLRGLCHGATVGSKVDVTPITPKPEDLCCEETHGYYSKTQEREIPPGNVHHHIITNDWNGKEWFGRRLAEHFDGPCPPGIKKVDPNPPRRKRK